MKHQNFLFLWKISLKSMMKDFIKKIKQKQPCIFQQEMDQFEMQSHPNSQQLTLNGLQRVFCCKEES